MYSHVQLLPYKNPRKLVSTNVSVCLFVFNATFNNILVISWRSVLLGEETGGHGQNHRSVVIGNCGCLKVTSVIRST